jgi:hypothetical protein
MPIFTGFWEGDEDICAFAVFVVSELWVSSTELFEGR